MVMLIIKRAKKILGPAIVTAIVGYKAGNLPTVIFCQRRSKTFDSRGSDK